MTQHRATAGASVRRRATAQATGRPYQLFSGCVLVAGVGLTVAGFSVTERLGLSVDWLLPFLILTAGFFLTDLLMTDVNVRRVDWTISFTEVPIVVGLLFAPFPLVLTAHLIAGIVMQVRRGAWTHLGYNTGVMCLEIAVPFLLLRAGEVVGVGVPVWLVALLAMLVSSLVSVGCGLLALQSLGAGLRAGGMLALAGRTMVLAVVNTVLGIVGYGTAIASSWGWLITVLLSGSVCAMGWVYARLLREQRDLGTLADISLNVARYRTDGGEDARRSLGQWEEVAEQIRDQLGANRVVVHLLDDSSGAEADAAPDDQAQVCTVVAGAPLPDGALPAGFWHRDALVPLLGSGVRYLRSGGPHEDVAVALGARGAHEALVVPLRSAARLLGAVEVHDKSSRWRGFDRQDVRLLRTVANHLSTATDNRRLVGKLRHDAYHDPQTGLLNRPGFLAAVADLAAAHGDVAMLRVDLDVLSTVSDALGYAWGDRMVVTAGQRLREQLGPDTPIARLEGASFAAVLADPAEDVGRTAARLREALSVPYPVGRLAVEANTFVGFASLRDNGDADGDVDVLLQHADLALRTARGGGGVRGYSPSMGGIFLRRFQLVTQFRTAVENGEVRAFYQPKVGLASRQLLGVEALVRWQHPEFGELSPDEFVPAVEATGLIDVLTSFITDQALAKIRAWLDEGVRMTVSVNLSVRSLDDDTFPDKVAEALRTHDVPAELLTFEITESGVMADPERALPVLRRLHALGVVLALDDFGTGYSSLAYLRQLPVDEVKIDKSFVLGMGTDLGDLAVVRSIVELGHSLGLVVVAEGVEDDAARDALREMSCDIAQGYLISRPLSEERLAQWLQARTLRDPSGDDTTILTLVP